MEVSTPTEPLEKMEETHSIWDRALGSALEKWKVVLMLEFPDLKIINIISSKNHKETIERILKYPSPKVKTNIHTLIIYTTE